MLHFPSANSAAHRPAARDVAVLSALLDDDVWAFSNCRVAAPGKPVAEVDWLFYNARLGTIMISEWKGFPSRVRAAPDTGKPWLLDNGLNVPNPIEQVARQLDVVRAALRLDVLPQYFPTANQHEVSITQSVYSPQVDKNTAIERIRWGKVYGSLTSLAGTIKSYVSATPLTLSDDGARLALATALCDLFRTEFPDDVKAKLQVPSKAGNTDVAHRISAIHRQIAALHEELADLMLIAAAGAAHTTPARPPAQAPKAAAKSPELATPVQPLATETPTKSTSSASTKTVTEAQRMQAHLTRTFKGVNGSKDDAAKALEKAWRAVLNDPLLHGDIGISVTAFGSAGTPLVKQHHGTLQKVLGMQLKKWCVLQAKAVGMKPRDVPGKPSNIRVR